MIGTSSTRAGRIWKFSDVFTLLADCPSRADGRNNSRFLWIIRNQTIRNAGDGISQATKMVERPFGPLQVASGRAISREFLASWLPDKKSICLNPRQAVV